MKPTAVPEPRSRAWLPLPAFLALVAAFVAVIVIALLSYRSLEQRTEASEAVNHTNEVEDHLHRLLSHIKDAETGQRGFLLTGAEAYLEPFQLSQSEIEAETQTLRRLMSDNALAEQRLEAVSQLITHKLAELQKTIDLRHAGDVEGALALVKTDRGKVLMDKVRDSIDQMLLTEQAALQRRTEEWEATVTSSTYVMFGGVAVLLGMLLLIGVLASRDFRAVAAEGWSRRVQLALTGQLQGDLRVESIGDKVLTALADNLGAQVGALYLTEPGGSLRRISGHALAASGEPGPLLRLGEGLTGQAAKATRTTHLRQLPEGYLSISSTLGKTTPRELAVTPARVDGVTQAVIELGFLHELDDTELQLLDRMSEAIALSIRTANDRNRLEQLLEEVQRQAEELQTQQEELRVSNEELEQQTRALQVSQAQLENQQSELEQINTQLEESAHALERQRDELARTSAELLRSNEVKSQFLANMSHELRTPLNSSLILAKLLADNREGNLNAEQIRFAQTIYSAGNDLLTLINDILDLSKIDAGMLDVRPELVPIARLADELDRTFQPVAAQKGLDFQVRIQGAPEMIETDPTRVMQILKNLVSNALKFTEHGGVSVEVTTASGDVVFEVRDTGIGIPEDQHELIFEAFRQADGASTRRFGGTGLGLSISRDLARLLGGGLRVASAPGKGSTFTLSLPGRLAAPRATPIAAVANDRPAEPRPERAERPERSDRTDRADRADRGTAERPPLERPRAALDRVPPPTTIRPAPFLDDRDQLGTSGRTLLIVEDDVAFARVLYDLAHELEFAGLVASTAADGLALARQYLPSAIVLDIGLPDRSGLAVLDSLKRDAATRHVPVHVVSAADYTRAALELGAAGYALKPVDRDRLVDAIRHLETKFTQKLRRVLIVEDDPVLRDSTARLLAGDDVETITAATTAEALSRLKATTFDCMVLDLSLPDRSGLELLEEMSRGEQYGFPPVIVYTGRSLSNEQVHELERFSQSIIIKGARSPERLLDEVTLFLHQVESKLPPDRQRMLREARGRESVFEGRRILVVEDDVRNIFALTSVLEPRGAVVEIARNGREAIEHLHARPGVDLVLMDIMMPEMDGLEATRRLRADPQFAKLPIIALTAKAMIDDRDKCLAAGANDYIAKPLDVDKLLSLARVWIRK
ncbi:MAG TPA: response regulator [Kofleriaceae bacterium]|nr:response regulator [Kofleriaceae bacterium]